LEFVPAQELLARHLPAPPADVLDVGGGPGGLRALARRVASWSWITNLPDQQRAAVLTQVRAMVGSDPQLTLRYRTEIYWTRLTE
jgi:hypothetical protein